MGRSREGLAGPLDPPCSPCAITATPTDGRTGSCVTPASSTSRKASPVKIEVIGVGDRDGTTLVAFTCAAGHGEGRWASARPAPAVGACLTVEIDIDHEPDEERRSTHVDGAPSLERTEGGVILTAVVERVDEDGVAVLRLSPDAMVLVETHFGWSEDDTVRLQLRSDALGLTPV
jgi:hypothetical protein